MPFRSLRLHPSLLKAVKELGFTQPTPIQADAIPPALTGKDLLACAMTGSGKTAAFLLPILHRVMDKPRGTTRALVLTPTRELAAQVHQELSDLAVHTPITGAAIYGGVGMGPQEHAFRAGVDVIVATPGRLLDHLRHPYARLDRVEYLVLDEADRMLDMGFLPDIRRVLARLPKKRQTLFFSATMPPPIVQLTREMLHEPATINLARKAAPATGITQAVYPVPQELVAAVFGETTLYKIDFATGQRTTWRTGLPSGVCCIGSGLAFAPDGGIYMAAGSDAIVRVTNDSSYTVVPSGASRSFTVGTEGTLYYLTSSLAAISRRTTTGQVGLVTSLDGLTGNGLVFNSVDSALYPR